MNNNEVIKNLRKALKASDQLKDEEIDKIAGLGSKIKAEGDVSDENLTKILDHLIVFKRGENKNAATQPIELPITNNIVLKKLRVAFEIKEDDLIAFVKEMKDKTQAREWSAYFRKSNHKHYRNCPDEFLMTVFKALQKYKG